jgi:uncharacterized Tic20 family protein
MNETPTSDEKVLAAIAHASVLFAWVGPIGPVLVWAFQRSKSRYVTFHALQAMGYQVIILWLWFLSAFLFPVAFIFVLVSMEQFMPDREEQFFLFPFIFMIGYFGLMGLFFVVGIAGAVLCLLGRDFRYPLIGRWLARRLFTEDGAVDEANEENWVGGLSHLTVIIQFWGLVTPLIVWLTQHERSVRLRFHSLQAVFYQLAAIVGQIVWFFGYLLMMFLSMFLGLFSLPADAASTASEVDPITGAIGLIMMIGFILIAFLPVLVVPLYNLIAIVGGILTMRGRDFRYPILGRIIANRIKDTPSNAVAPS